MNVVAPQRVDGDKKDVPAGYLLRRGIAVYDKRRGQEPTEDEL
jgi:hypothetical protein